MNALRAEAPAKVNRELRIGRRRPDGFHELKSRFTSIDLADVLEVETSGALTLERSGIPIPGGDEENLVLRAARALAAHAGVPPRARIRLEKRIPVGAGLGGGSSDAAAALMLLRRLWAPDLPEADLLPLAAALGSDVPYFLVGGEADVSGRGEVIVPRPDAAPAELILLVPPFALSTRDVFAAHARRSEGKNALPETLEIESTGNFFGPNELALAVLETNAAMSSYLESASENATESAMTGSGSAVVLFGAAAGIDHRLAQRHPEATVLRVRTLGRPEYRARTSPGGPRWISPR